MVGIPLRVGPLPVGRVIGGLCGGMALSAVRRWESGRPLPTDRRIAQNEIFAAQLRSFDIPRAPWRYLSLQRPSAGAQRAALTRRTVNELRSSLHLGRPVLIALVCALSRNPLALSRHHVCLAYGVRDAVDNTEVEIYDPNYPRRDDVRLQIAGPRIRHSRGRRVHAIFPLPIR